MCCEFLPSRKLLILFTSPFLVWMESAGLFIFFLTENTGIGVRPKPQSGRKCQITTRITRKTVLHDCLSSEVFLRHRYKRHLRPQSIIPHVCAYCVPIRIQSDIFFGHRGKPRKKPCKNKKYYLRGIKNCFW